MRCNQFVVSIDTKLMRWTNQERDRYDIFVGGLKDGKYVLELKEVRSIRSLEQNSFYWGVVIPTILDHLGERNTEENRLQIHEELLILFAPRVKGRLKDDLQVIRSKKMKVEEFSEYIENIIHYCVTEYGITFPEVER